MDQIFLSWRDFFKFLLEMVSFYFAVIPLIVFLRTNSFTDTVLAYLVCLPLLVISLVTMRIVEKKMFEILRGIRSGKFWLNRRWTPRYMFSCDVCVGTGFGLEKLRFFQLSWLLVFGLKWSFKTLNS